MRKTSLKKMVALANNLWERFMAFKVDFWLFDGHDKALDFAVDVRVLLDKHDSTRLIGDMFTGAINEDEFRKIGWHRKHRCFEDMCTIRKALRSGGYGIFCKGTSRYKCKKCPLY